MQMHLQGGVLWVICIKLPVNPPCYLTTLQDSLCCVVKNNVGTESHSSAEHYDIGERVSQRV